MKKRKLKPEEVKRIDANPDLGLNDQQVQERFDAGLTNHVKKIFGKSYVEIFVGNICTIYNLILVIIAALLIYAKLYWSLLFLVVYGANLAIGLFQDLRARYLLSKMHIVTQPMIDVIRNSKKTTIPTSDIVLDDIIILQNGIQIPVDAILIDGTIGVNESILTGESLTVYKERSAMAYAGSYITSGKARARVLRIGKDNYINSLETKARDNKKTTSQLKKSLDRSFWIIALIVVPLTILVFFANAKSLANNFKATVETIAGAIIAMIPAGLYLLASVSLTVGVINLSKKRTMVQDMYSLEMLARSTTLCLDKTGTITDGTMLVKELVTLNNRHRDEVELLIANIQAATKDDNATAKAIKKAFSFEATEKPIQVCPFNSENKYSFATFRSGTYVMGALECIDAIDKDTILKKVKLYQQDGLRVIVVGKAQDKQKNNKKLEGKVDILALVVLQDNIKPDAEKTIAWFQDNDVTIRVISGDNAITVSQIANRVKIKNADKFISLEGKTIDEVKKIAKDYVVFGRVSPEQKEALITALKEAGETVAMTGDGVNDILALRKADCSIAMANGADAAKSVSQLVMLDSNFSSLPAVVAEGRRTINNIQRTSSLFLMKTVFAMVLTFAFTINKFCGGPFYPFSTNNLYLWEFSVIGLGSFFIALEPNSEIIKGNFLKNVMIKVLPGSCMMMAGVGIFYMMYHFQTAGIMYTGIFNRQIFVTMCSIFFSIGAIATLYRVCSPFSIYRLIVLIGACLINILGIGFAALMEFGFGSTSLFMISLGSLLPVNYLEIAVVSIALIGVYLTVTYIVDLTLIKKEEVKTND